MKYPNIGVGIIIEDGDKVLLLRRKNVPGDGTWSTPGGYLEFWETPEEFKKVNIINIQRIDAWQHVSSSGKSTRTRHFLLELEKWN